MSDKTIVLATGNPSKVKELNEMLKGSGCMVRAYKEIIGDIEIEENGTTLEENAEIKARFVAKATGLPALADDTGLEVEALGNRPGVYSARYAGPACESSDNRKKMLGELQHLTSPQERKARFRTVLVFIDGEEISQFEGICEGYILDEERGSGGFGYDPIFCPVGHSLSFAEMNSDEKNKISHRGRALKAFLGKITKR